jgi:hypothetical protein
MTPRAATSSARSRSPDFYLFDGARHLVYRGQLDESRPGNGKPVTGTDLRAAIEATLVSRAVDPRQMPSLGWNIKWRPGNAAPYFGLAVSGTARS